MTIATLLIPAHNESAVIERTLLHLSRGLPTGTFRIVVIANGCSDSTAARARAALPGAVVLETASAGKCHALNLGYAVADKDKPVVCLDADLDVTAESLAALVSALRDGTAQAACGQMDVRTAEASSLVRAYYKGWRINPYFDRGKFGGLFALAPEAARRLFPLPVVTADDEYVRRSVARSDVAFVPACRFTVRAPATLASLLRVRRRSLRGAREISRAGLRSPERGSSAAILVRAVRRPSNAASVLVYATVNAWVRLTLLLAKPGRSQCWERDLTTRGEA